MDEWEIDFESALSDCGIKTSDFRDQESRLSAEIVAKLIEHCNYLKARHDFAITVAENYHLGTFHTLGYTMMTSHNLYDAFKRIAQYKKIVSNTCTFRVEEHAGVCQLVLSPYLYESTNNHFMT